MFLALRREYVSMTEKKKRVLNYKLIRLCVLGLIVVFIILGIFFFIHACEITDITVRGNIHYTADEIKEIVMDDKLSYNSILLSLKYRHKPVKDIPFVERIDVEVENNHSVNIIVYEKALAGYVNYLGSYMYFDKDGIVVEGSNSKTVGIPEVTGLSFDHIAIYEKLPVKDENVFQEILDMTKLLGKYEISADKIQFDSNMDMTLYFGNVRVTLGDKKNLDEKVMRLPYMLPSLEGESGVLHLENFQENTKVTTFTRDESDEPTTEEVSEEASEE